MKANCFYVHGVIRGNDNPFFVDYIAISNDSPTQIGIQNARLSRFIVIMLKLPHYPHHIESHIMFYDKKDSCDYFSYFYKVSRHHDDY